MIILRLLFVLLLPLFIVGCGTSAGTSSDMTEPDKPTPNVPVQHVIGYKVDYDGPIVAYYVEHKDADGVTANRSLFAPHWSIEFVVEEPYRADIVVDNAMSSGTLHTKVYVDGTVVYDEASSNVLSWGMDFGD